MISTQLGNSTRFSNAIRMKDKIVDRGLHETKTKNVEMNFPSRKGIV